jgi:alpha-glucosidase (family GH31 glycosyl hydrolase)
VLITEPFILTSSKRWEEAKQNSILATDKDGKPYEYDFYFGHTGLIDITKPAARDWFWQRYAELKKLGADGWWGDLGEPEVHPDDIQHAGGTAAQIHNIYGHEWAKLIAEKTAQSEPKERPFILMRAGYSGSQRFGMIPWSGDVNRSWGGLRSQPEITLQMGMQGMAYMHSDLGGFAGATDDDELYTRWLQYGVFQPVFRPHAQEEVPAEPVYRRDAAKARAKAAIELRYRLLPYNYTLAFENHRSGMPLMRPLFFTEAGSATTQLTASAYFWGNDFLVFPVLNAGQKTMQVSFPQGHDWIDFYSGVRYKGGSQQELTLNTDTIPVFVKSGAMIPMAEGLQSTEDFRVADLNWHIYPVAAGQVQTSSSQFYDDDGKTRMAWEQQAYALTHVTQQLTAEGVVLSVSEKTGKRYRSVSRQWTMYLHEVTQPPRAVFVDQKSQPFSYDNEKKTLRFTLTFAPGSQHQIRLPGLEQARS